MENSKRASEYAQRNNYVAPLREPSPRTVEVEVMRELPLAPITLPMPLSSHTDRAKGFSIATAPLATITGLVVAIVGVVGWSVPVASLITLLLALGGFAGVWLVAYLGHVFVSPDGALFAHTLLMWGYLRKEQIERHKRYRVKGGGQ